MRERSKVFRMIALISQIGITMLSSVFICGLIGYLVDHRFDTHIFLVTLLLGIAGGYRAVYALIKQTVLTENPEGGEETHVSTDSEAAGKASQESSDDALAEGGSEE